MVVQLRGESRYNLRAHKHRFVRHGVVGVRVQRRVVLRVVIVPDVQEIPEVPAEVIPEVQAIVAGPRVSRYDVSLMYLLTKPTALHGQMMYAFEGYTAIELYEIGRQLAVEYNQQNLNSPLGFLMGKYEDRLQYHCFNNCSVIVHYFKRFVH
jgi:hypothetical protein